MPYLICPACGVADYSATEPPGTRCARCDAARSGSERKSAGIRRWLIPLTFLASPKRVDHDLD